MISVQAAASLLHELHGLQVFGKVSKMVGLVVEGKGIKAPIGSVCQIIPDKEHLEHAVNAEIVGFRDESVLLMPYADLRGIRPGSLIRATNIPPLFPVGPDFLGVAVDAFGQPLEDDRQVTPDTFYPLHAYAPNPLKRPQIDTPLDVGVRAINGLLTLGKGQRIGIMAGSGVGKSTLLGMMARYTKADVNVIALIGERGREVAEFMDKSLGPEGLARSCLVIATSDQEPLVRIRAAYAATAVAEYFRDHGKDVLLMMDSVTRFAMAAREVGLAAGEPPTTKGYTPTVFAHLPRLLERAGRNDKGSITGIYTVLVEGDDFNEPIADSVRSILDGHIVLTRELADQGHFPSIDILKSVSRLRDDIVSEEHLRTGQDIVRHIATFRRVEDMVNIGAYSRGSSPEIDAALVMHPRINEYLCQQVSEYESVETSFEKLHALLQSGEQKAG